MDGEVSIKSGVDSFVGPAGDHAADPHEIRNLPDVFTTPGLRHQDLPELESDNAEESSSSDDEFTTPGLRHQDLPELESDNAEESSSNDAKITDHSDTNLSSNQRRKSGEHSFTFNEIDEIPEKVQRLDANSDSQSPNLMKDDVYSNSNEAEEIVQKICKNGKLMTLTEGDNFIKVIVYEDENADDTLSADDIEKDCGAHGNNGYRETASVPLNLFCDKSNSYSRTAETDMSQLSSAPSSQSLGTALLPPSTAGEALPCYNLFTADNQQLGSVSTASDIQSNFRQTVTQFAPGGLITCNVSDIVQPGHMTLPTDSHDKKQAEGPVQKEGKILCTPHPKNGQLMYYIAQSDKDEMSYMQSLAKPVASSTPMSTSKTDSATASASKRPTLVMAIATPAHLPLALNSSGEENTSPDDIISTPRSSHLHNPMRMLELPSYIEENGRIREQHNQKERRRRARIKDACSLMRQLVPGMSDKTDKATVFEFAARYVHFLKSFTGTEHDKDFLMKYSPY